MAHCHGGLDPRRDGIDAGGQAQEVDFFVLFADGVGGVDFGNVRVVLLEGLFQLGFLERFVPRGFDGLAVELFGGEL